MLRIVAVVVLLAVLGPALGAAEPALSIGMRLRLATVKLPEDSSRANPARVVREDANCTTLALASGEDPVTWTKEGRWLIGRIVAANDQHVTLEASGGTGRVVVRREDITFVALSEGRRSRGKGALIGAGVGAGVGALVGLASGDDPPGFLAFSAEAKATLAAIVLAPIGALIGLAIPPTERWNEVTTDRIRLSLAPVRGSVAAVSLKLGF